MGAPGFQFRIEQAVGTDTTFQPEYGDGMVAVGVHVRR